jgi:uncharacterized RDD family membrane protein YckC
LKKRIILIYTDRAIDNNTQPKQPKTPQNLPNQGSDLSYPSSLEPKQTSSLRAASSTPYPPQEQTPPTNELMYQHENSSDDDLNHSPMASFPKMPLPPNVDLKHYYEMDQTDAPDHIHNITGHRALAALIDLILIGVLCYLTLLHTVFVSKTIIVTKPDCIESQCSGVNIVTTTTGGISIGFIAVSALVYIIYFILLEWLLMGSLGKLILGLRVVNRQGGKISFAQSVIRNFIRIVDSLPFFIPYVLGYIFVITRKSHKRLGDMAANTFVLHVAFYSQNQSKE